MGFQNLKELSKNMHPVPRYSSSKLVHFSCRNQFWRHNSVYGNTPLLSMIGLNLGSPRAPSLKNSGFFKVMGPERDPSKTLVFNWFFDYSIHTVHLRNLKFRLKQVLKELFKMSPRPKKSVSPPQRYGQGFLFLRHPVHVFVQQKSHKIEGINFSQE